MDDAVLHGERVALGPLRRELAPRYARWVNDPEAKRGILFLGLQTLESEQAWIDSAKGGEVPAEAAFTVWARDTQEPIGTIALKDVRWHHRSADLGVLLGERRGEGLGTEAVRLVLRWAFEVLGLHSVVLEAAESNARAIRCYEKAGFRHAGRLREGSFVAGTPEDTILMDVLRTDVLGD